MHRHETHRDAVDEAFDELLKASLFEYAQKQEAFTQPIFKIKDEEPWQLIAVEWALP